ncbi:MAG: cation:proton antiporter [Anaerorhabdus sp.]
MEIVISCGIVLVAGILVGKLFEKIGIPGLVGMIFAGIIIGPYQWNVLDSVFLSYSAMIRQAALIVILLRAGISLKYTDFKETGKEVLMMSFLPALVEIIGITLASVFLLGFNWIDGLLLGTVISAVSPAVIVPKMIKVIDEGYGQDKKIPQLILAAASFDDILVLVLFSACLSFHLNGSMDFISFLEIPVSIIMGIIAGGAFGWILSLFLHQIHRIVQVIILGMLALLFYAVEGKIMFSALIALVSLGMSIRHFDEESASKLKVLLGYIWVVAEVFLFTLLGAAVNIPLMSVLGVFAVAVLTIGLLFRSSGVIISLSGKSWQWQEKLFCVFSYLPKATVQAAIGSIPLAYNLAVGEDILAISVLAILITAPLGALAVDKSYKKFLHKKEA